MKYIFTILTLILINITVMAKEIRTQIVIHATPEKVWQILTNFKDYPNWNPFIKAINGNVEVGKKFKATIQAPHQKPMTFKPRVLVFEKEQEFRWLGHLLMPGLFDGEHIFELIANQDGTTTFIQREKFRGILIPLFKKMLDRDTKAGFNMMNEQLKIRAEQLN
jgi:hypothetical protein